MRLATGIPGIPSMPDSHLLGPHSAFGKLLALSSAALLPHAVDYNLNLLILLRGSRGVGKFTVANWVAQHLGLHVFEVNLFPSDSCEVSTISTG